MDTANWDCVTCNKGRRKRYPLRLWNRGGDHKEIEPTLCDACADEHLNLDWVERRVTVSRD